MSISNEIREYASEYDRSYVFNYGEMRAFVARLDREMVELPKDRDGVPIHVGDTLFNSGKEYVVTCIFTDYCDHSFAFYANDNESVAYNPEAFTHTRPDSLETIADELEAWCDSADVNVDTCEKLADIADRIRKLAKREGE